MTYGSAGRCSTGAGTRHADQAQKAAHRHQLRPCRRAGTTGRRRGQMAVIRDRLSEAGDQAWRGRALARPAYARRRPLGPGDRTQVAAATSSFCWSRAIRCLPTTRSTRRSRSSASGRRRARMSISIRWCCADAETGLHLVRDKNLRPRDGKPLSGYPLHDATGI